MVTVRLKVKSGLISGALLDVSVTRPDLVTALASAILALAEEDALKVADLTRAVRVGRAARRAGGFAADPLGLGRPPAVHRTVWGLDLARVVLAARGVAEVVGVAISAARSAVAPVPPPQLPEPSPIPPLKPLDLEQVRRSLDRGAGKGEAG